MATAGNETRIGAQCRLGRGTREHPSRRHPSRGVDRVDRHARDHHPCVVYARYAVIDGGERAKGERCYYYMNRSEEIFNDKTERLFVFLEIPRSLFRLLVVIKSITDITLLR